MSLLSARERSAVCSTLERVGPDAPTLCGDWSTSELAAHLVMREGHPAAAGIALDFLADWTRRTQQSLAATDFGTLVQRVRNGPPWWSPLGWPRLESAANALELFIHHEDILRAQAEWQPRALTSGDRDELWGLLRRRARLLLRHSPVDVELQNVDIKKRNAQGRMLVPARHSSDEPVTLTGTAAELALYLHGRQSQAEVTVSGPADAVERFKSSSLDV